jgi:TetR/AcrR family transcriptional repressor of nem operon
VAIRTFFGENIERSVDDEQRRGCMLVNATLELAPDDPEFQRLVAEEMVFIEAFFRRCIEAGQNDGAIADARPAEELVKLFLLAIRVLARTLLPRALQTLRRIDAPQIARPDRPGCDL